MALTVEEVQHIARLARLELTPEQQELYREQLSAILEYVARLRELDTTDVPPTAGGGSVSKMPLRADRPRPGLPTGRLLENAPDTEDDQFKIPPVFE
jgi:aspartyl-tRNA(Asn)/glutamyl-tRNA(Gln) amidotransferase subunit C